MLGNEILVGVTMLGYNGKHVTFCLREFILKTFSHKKLRIYVSIKSSPSMNPCSKPVPALNQV